MKKKQYAFVQLFKLFIKQSRNGSRLQKNGTRIKDETIDNYGYVLKHLIRYDALTGIPLRIKPIAMLTQHQLLTEHKYWKQFYIDFTCYLHKQGCHDNYVGATIKCIRSCFNFIENDLCIPIGNFHHRFYVVHQEVPIITLHPEQLKRLIYDKIFEGSLSKPLQRSKDVFVVGCTVALRFSDLIHICWKDIETVGLNNYLYLRSQKTAVETRIKLPDYVMIILKKYQLKYTKRKAIFQSISLFRFNANIKRIAALAGYIQELGKFRNKQGVPKQLFCPSTKKAFRFCDLMSSHIMRRTAITTMLMNGVPELIVKRISGHISNSKSFYRYVNLIQSFVDTEIDRHFEKMSE